MNPKRKKTAKEVLTADINRAYENINEAQRGLKNELTKKVGDFVSMAYVNEKADYIAKKYKEIGELRIALAKV
jgi:hypothetical protein